MRAQKLKLFYQKLCSYGISGTIKIFMQRGKRRLLILKRSVFKPSVLDDEAFQSHISIPNPKGLLVLLC